ncbi:hypothetical protein BH09PLA1_BH09PLA1_23310 [soil metagenome]
MIAARQLLGGELSRRLQPLMEELADTLALVEAGIDFSDEPVSFLSAADAATRFDSIAGALRPILHESPRFERISHEPQVVLAGRPNAGKSTLLNALAGFDRAIVSPIADTTRDAIGAVVHLRRGLARVTDVAGLEDRPDARPDEHVARQMQEASNRAIESADVVVLLIDPNDPHRPALSREPQLTVSTKADLGKSWGDSVLAISAQTGIGMSALRDRLDDLCFGHAAANRSVALTARHVRAVDDALSSIDRARQAIHSGAEIIALELRLALDALGTIRGQVSSDDVLGRVFARFCIGK